MKAEETVWEELVETLIKEEPTTHSRGEQHDSDAAEQEDDNQDDAGSSDDWTDSPKFKHRRRSQPAKKGKKRVVVGLASKDEKGHKYCCRVCGAGYEVRKEMMAHEASEHAGQVLLCSVCSKTFTRLRQLTTHQRRMHGIREAAVRDDVEKLTPCDDGKFVCHLCGKNFLHVRSLRQHIDTFHLLEKSYSCHLCPKRFGRKDSLNKHQALHTGELNYVCEFCSRAFNQSANLLKHRRLMHTSTSTTGQQPRPFACKLCTGRYYSPGELANHVRISHEGVKDYRCLVCSHVFGGRSITRRHVKRVHKVNDPMKDEHFEKLLDPIIGSISKAAKSVKKDPCEAV